MFSLSMCMSRSTSTVNDVIAGLIYKSRIAATVEHIPIHEVVLLYIVLLVDAKPFVPEFDQLVVEDIGALPL